MSDEDWGRWEDKRQRSFTRGLEVSPEERLAWLEQMLEIALQAGAIPKPRDAWGQPIDTERPQV